MTIIPAPLAGWTDYAFRQILCDCGAKEVWTEMISATALYMKNEKTVKMLRPVKGKVRQVVQLFGNISMHFSSVIASGILSDYDEVNINMGCPAPKIVKNGCGCKLMTDFDKAEQIITECRKATNKCKMKLSVKFRLGWDNNVSVDFAKMCQRCKVDRLILHGRLGIDGYRGQADYEAIARVKAAIRIPLIANGDIKDKKSMKNCIKITKADGVMVGRALCGAPWKIKLNDKTPSEQKMLKIIKKHVALHDANPSDLQKHLLCYKKRLKTLPNLLTDVTV